MTLNNFCPFLKMECMEEQCHLYGPDRGQSSCTFWVIGARLDRILELIDPTLKDFFKDFPREEDSLHKSRVCPACGSTINLEKEPPKNERKGGLTGNAL